MPGTCRDSDADLAVDKLLPSTSRPLPIKRAFRSCLVGCPLLIAAGDCSAHEESNAIVLSVVLSRRGNHEVGGVRAMSTHHPSTQQTSSSHLERANAIKC